jgi:hypothetical protein
MDLTQLLLDLLVLAGVLLFGLLAVVPLWLEGRSRDRQPAQRARLGLTQRQPRGGLPTSGPISRTMTSPISV